MKTKIIFMGILLGLSFCAMELHAETVKEMIHGATADGGLFGYLKAWGAKIVIGLGVILGVVRSIMRGQLIKAGLLVVFGVVAIPVIEFLFTKLGL